MNLNEILQEAVRGAEKKCDSPGIKLQVELDDELPRIQADRGHLCQALGTILQNACHHMPEQSRLLVTTSYDGAAVVRLAYPALHMAEDDMDHFFYPFVAEELVEADLEVPLTKMVIHRHGGIINIDRDEEDQIVITISFSPAVGRRQQLGGS